MTTVFFKGIFTLYIFFYREIIFSQKVFIMDSPELSSKYDEITYCGLRCGKNSNIFTKSNLFTKIEKIKGKWVSVDTPCLRSVFRTEALLRLSITDRKIEILANMRRDIYGHSGFYPQPLGFYQFF